MAYTFPTTYFPSVRAAIGLEVDEIQLPDPTLNLEVYKGEAERFVRRNLTEVQYTHVEQIENVHHAAALYLASIAVRRLRIVQSERIAGGNLSYAPVDVNKIGDSLLEAANRRVSDILVAIGGQAPSKQASRPAIFTKARRRFPRNGW